MYSKTSGTWQNETPTCCRCSEAQALAGTQHVLDTDGVSRVRSWTPCSHPKCNIELQMPVLMYTQGSRPPFARYPRHLQASVRKLSGWNAGSSIPQVVHPKAPVFCLLSTCILLGRPHSHASYASYGPPYAAIWRAGGAASCCAACRPALHGRSPHSRYHMGSKPIASQKHNPEHLSSRITLQFCGTPLRHPHEPLLVRWTTGPHLTWYLGAFAPYYCTPAARQCPLPT